MSVGEQEARFAFLKHYSSAELHQRSQAATQSLKSSSKELSIAVKMGKVKKAKKEKGDNKAEVRPRSLASASPRTESSSYMNRLKQQRKRKRTRKQERKELNKPKRVKIRMTWMRTILSGHWKNTDRHGLMNTRSLVSYVPLSSLETGAD